MAFEKVEYKFPDPDDTAKQNIEIEDSSAIEVDLSGKKEKKMNQKLTEQMIRESRKLRLKMSLKSKLLMNTES